MCNCIFYVFVHNHFDMFVTEELSEHTKMNISCTKNATDIIFLNEQLFMSACDEHHVQNSILSVIYTISYSGNYIYQNVALLQEKSEQQYCLICPASPLQC